LLSLADGSADGMAVRNGNVVMHGGAQGFFCASRSCNIFVGDLR
jgi:hypothetical protein